MNSKMRVIGLRKTADYLAPDGSQVRLLAEGDSGGLAHCVLGAGAISRAVRHVTVEELWYVLEGRGELWLSAEGQEKIESLTPGASVGIAPGTSFQFRATAEADLAILVATMPPWPGAEEAEFVAGQWSNRPTNLP